MTLTPTVPPDKGGRAPRKHTVHTVHTGLHQGYRGEGKTSDRLS
jgi:hypothetical protein